MFEKLIKVVEQKKEVDSQIKQKKIEFENSIEVIKAMLDDLEQQEVILREEALLELEANKLNSFQDQEYTITKNIKITKVIKNPEDLYLDITSKISFVKEYIPHIDIDLLFEREVVVKDKKSVDEVIDKYEKIEGDLLEGVEKRETKFITIKHN